MDYDNVTGRPIFDLPPKVKRRLGAGATGTWNVLVPGDPTGATVDIFGNITMPDGTVIDNQGNVYPPAAPGETPIPQSQVLPALATAAEPVTAVISDIASSLLTVGKYLLVGAVLFAILEVNSKLPHRRD